LVLGLFGKKDGKKRKVRKQVCFSTPPMLPLPPYHNFFMALLRMLD
jgi:hypothetical protein